MNIETGEPMEVPVTTAWAVVADGDWQDYGDLWNSARGYYDITDPLLGTGNYAPTEVDQSDNVYNATNVFVTGSIVVDADSYKFSAPLPLASTATSTMTMTTSSSTSLTAGAPTSRSSTSPVLTPCSTLTTPTA